MKKFLLLFSLCIYISVLFPQSMDLQNLLLKKEMDPAVYIKAKQEAIKQQLPVSIYFPEKFLADVIAVEYGEVLYNLISLTEDAYGVSELLNIDQIRSAADLSRARINYGNGRIVDNTDSPLQEKGYSSSTKLLLIPEWTNDNVLAFDPATGDLVTANFTNPDPVNLASPKHAILHQLGFISISDQIKDLVQKYDTGGVYIQIFAPAGGVNTSILDNLRGHAYHPVNGDLLVTVGSGVNTDAVPRFDAAGNYLNNFIAAGAGGLLSPFSIVSRNSDILVSGSGSDAVHRYDFSGNSIGTFASGINFPQQITKLAGGKIAVAIFSSPSGLKIYDSTGTELSFFTTVTGLRGIYPLTSGSLLVTNGTGVHEINATTGALIRTVLATANAQFIELADYSIIPVELTSFSAEVTGRDVMLKWSTATEINNKGFEVQRSTDGYNFIPAGFLSGAGTSAEKHIYTFTDKPDINSLLYYRLKQIDYDGSVEYSEVIEADLNIPVEFVLGQNFPNPFNPVTNIRYAITTESNVSLKVFDVLGREVATLVNTTQAPGHYEITFESPALSSGIYIYQLSSGNQLLTRKMNLLR